MTKLSERLLEDVVIAQTGRDAGTGAHSIEPGHVARREDVERPIPARAAALAGEGAAGLRHRVEQFLYHQAELLDGKHWREYVDLFADDGHYWMPVTPEQTEWLDSPSIFAEDKSLMAIRIGRVTHPNAWSQAPMWGTSHLVGNTVIEFASDAEVIVRSRFQMMELRRDAVRHFAGTYRHTLLRQGDGFVIRLQRVDLLNGRAPFDYVLQVWV
jgi:3-phenylpropionate/cinnamic acid dioxygenase small subunit